MCAKIFETEIEKEGVKYGDSDIIHLPAMEMKKGNYTKASLQLLCVYCPYLPRTCDTPSDSVSTADSAEVFPCIARTAFPK